MYKSSNGGVTSSATSHGNNDTLFQRRLIRSSNKNRLPSSCSRQTLCVLVSLAAIYASVSSLWRRISPSDLTKSRPPPLVSRLLSRTTNSETKNLPIPPDDQGVYDVIVLGVGPAGLSAALYSARMGLSTLVLGSPASSLLTDTLVLDNYPSYISKQKNNKKGDGQVWLQQTQQQAQQFGATFGQAGLLVNSISQKKGHNNVFELTTQLGDTYKSHAVIVATGAKLQQLNLPGEGALWGHSLHTCAICDASGYVGRRVVVVGGGDAAVDAALLLSRHASQVTLIHRRNEFSRAKHQGNVALLKSTPNIELLTPYQVVEWEVSDETDNPSQLTGALVETEGGIPQRIPCDGAFVLIGATPNTQWLKDSFPTIETKGDDGLLLKVGATSSSKNTGYATATSIPGLFAAGEVTDNVYKQAITAAAAGAQAGIDAERWLREHSSITPKQQQQRAALQSSNGKQSAPEDYFDARKPEASNNNHDCDLTSLECIQSTVKQYPVVVFSKPTCPYCRKAMEALSLEGVSVDKTPKAILVVDLTHHEHGSIIQDRLQELTGRRTVPNVFIGGKNIGGGDETVELHQSGGLTPLLREANAIEITPEVVDDGVTCDLSDAECIRSVVKEHPVVVFAKASCPECGHIFELLNLIGVTNPFAIDLSAYGNLSQDIQYNLLSMTGRHAVPNIFIGGESIGGYDLAMALHEQEKLVPMLQSSGAM